MHQLLHSHLNRHAQHSSCPLPISLANPSLIASLHTTPYGLECPQPTVSSLGVPLMASPTTSHYWSICLRSWLIQPKCQSWALSPLPPNRRTHLASFVSASFVTDGIYRRQLACRPHMPSYVPSLASTRGRLLGRPSVPGCQEFARGILPITPPGLATTVGSRWLEPLRTKRALATRGLSVPPSPSSI